jgi:Dockerin type I domain
LFFSFFFLTSQSYAQNTPICGYVPTPAEKALYQSVMAQMNSGSAPQQVLTPIPLNTSIPIYFWVNSIASQIGFLHEPPSAAQLTNLVERMNAYFHFPNNAHFTFCGMSYVDDPRWYTMPTNPNSIYPLSTLDIDYHKNNVINVFVPKNGGLNTKFGPASVLLGSVGSFEQEINFAHELGHCFSLMHTFNEPPVGALGAVKEIVIRNPDPAKPNAPNCGQSADLMCSTPADFSNESSNDLLPGCHSSQCPYYCAARDANNDPYMPDMSNIMSYHRCSNLNYSFTAEQQNKMNNALQTTHSFLFNTPCAGDIANFGLLSRSLVKVGPPPTYTQTYECTNSNDIPIIIKGANVAIQNSSTGALICATNSTSNAQGFYQSCKFPINSSVTLIPTRNINYLEKVTTLDVALISQHILGTNPFTLPYQMLAADVDNNGDIDAIDMLYIRRLILRLISTFPNNVGSWRFVPKYFLEQPSFLSAFNSNPFTATTQGYSYLSNSYMDKVSLNMALPTSQTTSAWSFAPFKVGDVNYCRAGAEDPPYNNAVLSTPTFDPNSLSSARVANNLYTTSTARTISMNSAEERTIVLKTKNAVSVMAFQLGMRFLKDKFKINQVQKGEFDTANDVFDFNNEDKGEFRALWYDKRGQVKNLKAGTILLTAKVKANVNVADLLAVINLDDQILANEFYDAKGKLVPVDMEWTNEGNTIVGNTMTVNAFPNPFTNEVSFDINSPVAGSAKITITNIITGQSHTSQKQFAQGANLVTINNVASLSAGALTYTIVVGTQVVNGSITKTR